MAKAVSFEISDIETRALAGRGCRVAADLAALEAEKSVISGELRNRAVDAGLGGARGTKAVIETDVGSVSIVHVNPKLTCELQPETVRRIAPEVFRKVYVEKVTYTFNPEAYDMLSDDEKAQLGESVSYGVMAARVTYEK